MTIEPHAIIYVQDCSDCGAHAYNVVTIPKLATGEHFPVLGFCAECKIKRDLKGSPPIE